MAQLVVGAVISSCSGHTRRLDNNHPVHLCSTCTDLGVWVFEFSVALRPQRPKLMFRLPQGVVGGWGGGSFD